MKRGRKAWIFLGGVLVLILGLALYFRPLALGDFLGESRSLTIVYTAFAVENGKALQRQEDYDDITAAQQEKIRELLGDYACRRKVTTMVSDGSLEDLGEGVLTLYVHEGGELHTLTMASSGKLSANGREYRLPKAGELMGKIRAVFQE